MRTRKKITITLSDEGLLEASNWLKAYSKRMMDKANGLLGKMLTQGERYAANALGHIDTGKTLSTLMAYREGNHGMIIVGGNAIWIEFGTGVLLNGIDNVHNRKELGINEWGTFAQDGSGVSKGSGADGWYYWNEERGQVEHTYGIPMNPFMYNTAKMLREEYANYAKEIFSK